MSDGAKLNISVQRNEDFARVLQFTPQGSDSGWNITNCSVSLSVWLPGTTSAVLSVGQSANGNGSLLDMSGAGDGQIGLLLKKADLSGLPGRAADINIFSYNLILTDADAIKRCLAVGSLIVEPGV